MNAMVALLRAVSRDLLRILPIVSIGTLLVIFSTDFALALGEPAFAPWGLFTGGAFYVAAVSHVLRRVLFYRLDLQTIARDARQQPTGAGLVFLGVCLVLAAFVLMSGAMLRV